MPNWKDGAVLERLIAAIVASNGCKVRSTPVSLSLPIHSIKLTFPSFHRSTT